MACWNRGNKHLRIGALASHVLSVRYMSEVRVYRRRTQVQLIRGEFLETALYWAGVVSFHLGAIAEKKVSEYSVSRFQCVFDSQSTSGFIRRLELIVINLFVRNGEGQHTAARKSQHPPEIEPAIT